MADDPVNTENGDFTEQATDTSIPTFGPSLDFTRAYDAQAAQAQTQAGTPGALGYGWTDNWATSLKAGQAVPGDIYAIDGLATSTGEGGSPTGAALNWPNSVYHHGDVYIADTSGNRVLEIPGSTGTQWGKSMTAGDIYTIVGSPAGAAGHSPNGTALSSSLLDQPGAVTIDSTGNLFIADAGNNRVLEVPVTAGTYYGVTMTVVGDVQVPVPVHRHPARLVQGSPMYTLAAASIPLARRSLRPATGQAASRRPVPKTCRCSVEVPSGMRRLLPRMVGWVGRQPRCGTRHSWCSCPCRMGHWMAAPSSSSPRNCRGAGSGWPLARCTRRWIALPLRTR